MNARANHRNDRSEELSHDGIPSPKSGDLASQIGSDSEHDLLGKSLESIIAGVAAERTRAGEALRALAARLIEAQEEERRRLARELHDGLNQQLAMLTVELGMLTQQVPDSVSAIREQLSRLRDRAEGLSSDLRHMTHQLHPAALEHLGLISALRSHCVEFSRNEGIRVWFSVVAEKGSIRPEVAVCLYRITQEALRNVVKHSRAQEAWVEVDQGHNGIRLSITDKGVGFDLRTAIPGKCLGLISMRERVQLISGKVSLKSAPGKGTCVEVRVPVRLRKQMKPRRRNYAKT